MSTSSANPWSPYGTYRDCSQGLCTLYCPQWCYFTFPPPPHPPFADSSIADFSPLVVAVIGVITSAFILLTYYFLVSRYCKRPPAADGVQLGARGHSESAGLDEAVIKTIRVCKYKKNDGFVEANDCSVCLAEFREDETLRLLPKCNHAFHLPCIDAWLKNHATCPLCRSNISFFNPLPIPSSRNSNVSVEEQHGNDAVLEIRDVGEETEHHVNRGLRRWVSLDSVSRQDILVETSDDDENRDCGSSRRGQFGEEDSKAGNGGNRDINLVRSKSTGRFMMSRYGIGRSSTTMHP